MVAEAGCRALSQSPIDLKLLLFRGKLLPIQIENLGAVQTHSLCAVDLERRNLFHHLDIGLQSDTDAVLGLRRKRGILNDLPLQEFDPALPLQE